MFCITSSNKKSSIKVVYSPTEEIKQALINFVKSSESEKDIRKKKEENATILRDYIKSLRKKTQTDKKNDNPKTFRIIHEEDDKFYAADVTFLDKYALPCDKDIINVLKKKLTTPVYEQLFEERITIELNEIIANNPKERRNVIDAIKSVLGSKFDEYFKERLGLELKPGINKRIDELTEEQRKILFTYVRPSEPIVRNVSHQKI